MIIGKNVGIIGAGSWGIALCHMLLKNGCNVTVWSALSDEIDMLNKNHEHIDKLPGVKLDESVLFTTDLEEAVKNRDFLILAVPSPFVRKTARALNEVIIEGQIIVNVAKGVEEDTLMTLSQIIEQEAPKAKVAVLCGPTHAEEVGMDLPTAIVVGCEDSEIAKGLQDVLMNEVFRVYTGSDVMGMEIGSALKNVIALAAGMADGCGCGDNTKAALITRGIHEISRLGVAMGCKVETFYGLTGIGDLIVTCASMHSRNRRAGILIGQGKTMDEAMTEVKMVVEGVYSAKAANSLAKKYDVSLPIIEAVNQVLFEDMKASEAIKNLMMRDKKEEV